MADEAFNKLLQLISYRERSTKELVERLSRAGLDARGRGEPRFSAAEIERAIARATQAGLVDDKRFAELYIRSKQASGWGRRKIENGLSRAGIKLAEEPGYPDAFFDSDDLELDRAKNDLAHYHSHAKDQYGARLRHLLSHGFSYDIAKQAIAAS
ncbi:MAG: recombination regulator RecX [Coriobacteriales bacterium]|jgi:regulatory protein|nr:recombination regulator RecX [Coriobacteriales bacterium]